MRRIKQVQIEALSEFLKILQLEITTKPRVMSLQKEATALKVPYAHNISSVLVDKGILSVKKDGHHLCSYQWATTTDANNKMSEAIIRECRKITANYKTKLHSTNDEEHQDKPKRLEMPQILIGTKEEHHHFISYNIEGPLLIEETEIFKLYLIDIDIDNTRCNKVEKIILKTTHSLIYKMCENALEIGGNVKLKGTLLTFENLTSHGIEQKIMLIEDENLKQALWCTQLNPQFNIP